jgi:hypothetical protein
MSASFHVVVLSMLIDPDTDLELGLVGDSPLQDVLLETLNGVVLCSHILDLLSGTVSGSWVGHADLSAEFILDLVC